MARLELPFRLTELVSTWQQVALGSATRQLEDEIALEALRLARAQALYQVQSMNLLTPEDADEVASVCAMTLVTHLSRLRAPEAATSYLRGMVSNRLVDRQREVTGSGGPSLSWTEEGDEEHGSIWTQAAGPPIELTHKLGPQAAQDHRDQERAHDDEVRLATAVLSTLSPKLRNSLIATYQDMLDPAQRALRDLPTEVPDLDLSDDHAVAEATERLRERYKTQLQRARSGVRVALQAVEGRTLDGENVETAARGIVEAMSAMMASPPAEGDGTGGDR